MAKLLKLRRGTTTQHASFTGAEGELTVDVTKDTAVVHDGSQAGGRPLAREDMSNVSSANIAGQLGTDSIATSKIAAGALPTDVTVASANLVDGTIVNADVNISAAIAGSKISPNFGSQDITTTGKIQFANVYSNEADLPSASTYHGMFAHVHSTGLAYFAHAGNWIKLAKLDAPDFTGGIDVTGNISVTGTVDGRDVAADGTKLDGIESGSTGDQTAAEIRTLVESASDSNVFTDADHSKLNGIESGSTGDQTAAEIRTLVESASDSNVFTDADHSKLNGIESGATADQSASEILTLIKTVDGTGSGLDADTVDGISSESFLRSNTADTAAGDITFTGGAGAVTVSAGSDIRLNQNSSGWTGEYEAKIQHHAGALYIQGGSSGHYLRNGAGSNVVSIDTSGNLTATGNVTAYSDQRLKTDIHTINDALGICGKLRGVSYKWIADGKAGIGVIAQEVEEVIPEVVLTKLDPNPATGEETEVKSVDYGKIVGVLINAINELKAEVDELKGGK